ncbi:growth hormone secretagogue receptor type 1-like [Tubulanus polymorphus]|uniref:growth hormone secretagogue receptor type 1-like n=1 Tax=Tubulanus polymorphus TaxID=672921 RepID=UPI003DA216DE
MSAAMLNGTVKNGTLTSVQPTNSDYLSIDIPPALTISVTFMFVFVLVFGIIGNILVIFVVMLNKDMRNSTNLFLVNLTVADLLVLLVCTPIALQEFYNKDVWNLGEGMCKLLPFLENAVTHASVLTILAISMERYYAICHPLRAPALWTNRCLSKLLTVVWSVAVISTLPFFFMAELMHKRALDGTPILVCQTLITKPWQQVYITAIAVCFLLVPFVIMIILYGIVGKKLLYDKCALGNQTDDKAVSALHSRRQIVIMLISITVIFFVCLLPFRVLSLYLIYNSMEAFKKLGIPTVIAIVYFCRLMIYINSAINPIVYNVISTKFRKAFKQILTRYVCCESCTWTEMEETPSPFVRVNPAYRRSVSQAIDEDAGEDGIEPVASDRVRMMEEQGETP